MNSGTRRPMNDRVLDSNTSTIRAAHLHRAEQFIRNNLSNEDLSSSLVAEACNVSLRYLQQLFLDADRSVSGFIREKRLVRAREDLSVEGSTTVAEIAKPEIPEPGRHVSAPP